MRHHSFARTETYWAIEPRHFAPLFQPNAEITVQAARPTDDEQYVLRDGVAIIDIAGVMTKGQTLYTMIFGGATMPTIERKVRLAAADSAVNAILLRIDSPGGTVAGVSDLADAVFEARRQKPVTAYISDMGASAAYYVASQADQIYSDVDAMVGSIGVYLVVPDYSKAAENMGVKVHVVKAGDNKGAGTPGTPVTDEQLAEFQREVNQLNETFVDAVARGRGWSTEKVAAVNDGRVHVGRYAQSLGLVDGVMAINDVMRRLRAQSLNPSKKPISWRRVAGQNPLLHKEDSNESITAKVS